MLSRSLGALGFVLTAVGVVGSLVAPLVVGGIGVRGALLLFGAVVLGGIIPAGLRLRRAARTRPAALDLLAEVSIFGSLPAPVLEGLAEAVEHVSVAAGDVIFHAGDEGDSFYVVARGSVELSANGRVIATEAAVPYSGGDQLVIV